MAGLLDNYGGMRLSDLPINRRRSVMDGYQEPRLSNLLDPAADALQSPSVLGGLLSLDPTDYIGPNTLAKAGMALKGLLGAGGMMAGLTAAAKAKGVTTAPSALAQGLRGQRGMTAWHGSPHKFDKFTYGDKVRGTGEGAQVYGDGLYLAETPEVAKAYRSNLVKDPTFIEKKTGAKIAKGDPSYDGLLERQARMERNGYGADFDKKYQIEEGALYKTDIPDEAVARFLDWDKPLSQQSHEVRSAYAKALADGDDLTAELLGSLDSPQAMTMAGLFPNSGGSQAYRSLADGSSEASQRLLKSGIPGIRFLDGGSRSAGQGSSNFVAFDPEMIRILERNGQPTGLQPWMPGEYQTTLRGLLSP